MRVFLCLFYILTLASCASIEKDLTNDLIDKSSKKLQRCQVDGFEYNGINQHLMQEKPLKILMVHGVGTHYPGYSDFIQEKLANNIGFNKRSRLSKNISLVDPQFPQKDLGNLRVTHWQDTTNNKEMFFYELAWSEITIPYKNKLRFDIDEQSSEFRVPFNNTMKKFLDNVLPDPMIYLVDPYNLIINSNKQAVCWMLKDDWNTLPYKAKEVCNLSAELTSQKMVEENVMFITHSLGSEIVIDAITSIAEDMGNVKQLQEKELTIFMLANQLPMLLIAKPEPKVHSQKEEYCDINGSKYNQRIFKNINVVAFSDPNDLLSYNIPQSFADEYIDSRLCADVTNVSVNVAPEIDAFGVEIVDPVLAHTYYDRSNKVINLITNGTNNFNNDKYLKDKCKFIKL
ncbi:MAG: hypothetical protein R3Y43_02775 [Alphaproteobacteria bacterium]